MKSNWKRPNRMPRQKNRNEPWKVRRGRFESRWSQINRSISKRCWTCSSLWWMQFKIKARSPMKRNSSRKSRQMMSYSRQIRYYQRLCRTLRREMQSCLPSWTLSRSTREFSSMPFQCSASFVMFSSLLRHSLIMWRVALRKALQIVLISSRYPWQ